MAMNIYVGNLSRTTAVDDLVTLFSRFGNVRQARIIMSRATGESRGFAFVDMRSAEEAERAVAALNGTIHDDRPLEVSLLGPHNHRAGQADVARGTDSPEVTTNGTGANGVVMGRPAKLPPELIDWARREFSEEEILAGIREIRETGGLELKDFIDELEDILYSPND